MRDPRLAALAGCDPVILVGGLMAGGSERQACLLAAGLQAAGLRPGVVVWTVTDLDVHRAHLEQHSLPVVEAPQSLGRLGKVHWLRQAVRQLQPGVLHSYAFFLNAVAAWAMRGTSGVAIGAIRGDYRVEVPNGRLHYAANRRWPALHISNSARAAEDAHADRSPFRPSWTVFVPNGLDCSAYVVRQHAARRRPRIVGVANLLPVKRWDALIRAVAVLRDEDPPCDFSVEIVGEGEERPRLAALIEDLGLGARVALLGRRSDVPSLLADADIFVIVSASEGTPNAVMEAMAAGLPVIAPAVGDIPRLVESGREGFLLADPDDRRLVWAVRTLVTDPELRARLGQNARLKAEAEFSIERLVQGTLDAYRRAGWRGAGTTAV